VTAAIDAVRVGELRRTYTSRTGVFRTRLRTVEALRGVTLVVREGELFGFLGPNGAGKTTFVKVLATILLPTSGSVEVLGYDAVRDASEVRRRIGIVFGGERGLYYTLSARDNLRFFAALYRLAPSLARQRVEELLDLVGLGKRADDRVETYSRGMKQRLHLARGLLAGPKLLLLDEPTIGLDPVAANEIRQLIRALRAQGIAIFLTTHNMAEAESLCDRVAFINEGRVILLDRPRELTRAVAEFAVVEAEVPAERAADLARELRAVVGVSDVESETTDAVARFVVRGEGDVFPPVLQVLARHGARRVNSREPTLEDVYLKLLGYRGMRV